MEFHYTELNPAAPPIAVPAAEATRGGRWDYHNRKGSPCPVCRDVNDVCRTNPQGTIHTCKNFDGDIPGFKFVGKSELGDRFNLFIETGEDNGDRPQPRQYEKQHVAPDKKHLTAKQWNREFRAKIAKLTLSDRHRKDFLKRGLSPQEIDVLSDVARSTARGIVIPFRNVDGLFTGAQVRLDEPGEGGRYIWDKPLGHDYAIDLAETKQWPIAVYRPTENRYPNQVWWIEGTGIKPSVASIRHGAYVIGASGGAHHLSPIELRQSTERLFQEQAWEGNQGTDGLTRSRQKLSTTSNACATTVKETETCTNLSHPTHGPLSGRHGQILNLNIQNGKQQQQVQVSGGNGSTSTPFHSYPTSSSNPSIGLNDTDNTADLSTFHTNTSNHPNQQKKLEELLPNQSSLDTQSGKYGKPLGATAIDTTWLHPESLQTNPNYSNTSPLIVLPLDGGDIFNKSVLLKIEKKIALAQVWGYQVVIGWWGQIGKDSPDIDEIEPGHPIAFLSPSEFWAIVRKENPDFFDRSPAPQNSEAGDRGQEPDRSNSFKALVNQVLGRAKQAIGFGDRPTPKAKPITTYSGHEYQKGDRLKTWQTAYSQGYQFILDQSGTGTGKSHDSGNIAPEMFGARQAIYLSGAHRNPTTEPLTEQNGWTDLPARHGGLTWDVDGVARKLRRSEPGEGYSAGFPANCSRNGSIAQLRAKNVKGSDSSKIICATCPLKEVCAHASGVGYGFLSQRRDGLQSQKLRSHPDSLPSPTDYDFERVALLWEESGENFRTQHEVKISLSDIEATIAALLTTPTLFDALRPNFEALLAIFDEPLGRFGLSHADILAKLPPVPALDMEELILVLRPDLSLLNTTEEYGVDLADLPRQLRKHFADKDGEISQKIRERTIKQWLPEFLGILNGNRGYLHLGHDGLVMTLPDDRHREASRAARVNIFLDATLSREDLASKLGCSPDDIYLCRQAPVKVDNASYTQVTDLGRLGMQRGNDQGRRVEAIVSHYQAIDPTTKAIDFKKFTDQGNGAWWRDSRGSNDFLDCKTLVLIGTPTPNLAALQAEFACLGGNPTGEDFTQWVDRKILAEFQQAIGRLRAHLRPGEQLHIVIVSNHDLAPLGLPIQQVKAQDITPEAGTKTQRLEEAIRNAAKSLAEMGQSITQSAIAKLVGISQQYISKQFKRLLLLLIETYKAKVVSPEVDVNPELAAMAQAVEEIGDSPPIELLKGVREVFFDWVEPDKWGELIRSLSPTAQLNLISALAMTQDELLVT